MTNPNPDPQHPIPGARLEDVPKAIAMPDVDDPRNWPEDFDDDNGQYMNKCLHCDCVFIGHKRRCVCKLCAKATPPMDHDLNIVDGMVICGQCLDGAGGECHTPGCVMWIKCAPDIEIRSHITDCGGSIRPMTGPEDDSPDDAADTPTRAMVRVEMEAIVERVLEMDADMTPGVWVYQSSNSWQRIGSQGDGDVVCPTNNRHDGHPDLSARPEDLEGIAYLRNHAPALARYVRQVEAELAEARETNRRLNRRCQEAESSITKDDRQWAHMWHLIKGLAVDQSLHLLQLALVATIWTY